MDLNAVLLAEIGKKLVKPGAVSGVVAVSSKPFTGASIPTQRNLPFHQVINAFITTTDT
ncbi:MAG: hypothetical protein XD78_1113 [Desulfotomaculum sp. 46_296]|nr:MAG: hypothetical protein XD78_1113 [Desulfotomaculum sp. 46_296]